MSSVTQRIKEINQPRGGYIKPSEFEKVIFDDDKILNETENIHSSIIGMAVDYLTRFLIGKDKMEAFIIPLNGVLIAKKYGKMENAFSIADELLNKIKGIDSDSIINACKLVTFDVWCRNYLAAAKAKNYSDTNPDTATVQNIRTLVERGLAFFKKYGPVIKDGFTFESVDNNSNGGYTKTVDTGDGDFLTKDTLWDFKVSKTPIKSNHTLQLLMYWIMGQHSGQEIYKNIDKLGVFNPRLNTVYLLDINKIPLSTIETVEKEVICY